MPIYFNIPTPRLGYPNHSPCSLSLVRDRDRGREGKEREEGEGGREGRERGRRGGSGGRGSVFSSTLVCRSAVGDARFSSPESHFRRNDRRI